MGNFKRGIREAGFLAAKLHSTIRFNDAGNAVVKNRMEDRSGWQADHCKIETALRLLASATASLSSGSVNSSAPGVTFLRHSNSMIAFGLSGESLKNSRLFRIL